MLIRICPGAVQFQILSYVQMCNKRLNTSLRLYTALGDIIALTLHTVGAAAKLTQIDGILQSVKLIPAEEGVGTRIYIHS